MLRWGQQVPLGFWWQIGLFQFSLGEASQLETQIVLSLQKTRLLGEIKLEEWTCGSGWHSCSVLVRVPSQEPVLQLQGRRQVAYMQGSNRALFMELTAVLPQCLDSSFLFRS